MSTYIKFVRFWFMYTIFLVVSTIIMITIVLVEVGNYNQKKLDVL
jgi:hypothetical protein